MDYIVNPQSQYNEQFVLVSNENALNIAITYAKFNTIIVVPEKIYKVIYEVYRSTIRGVNLAIFHKYQIQQIKGHIIGYFEDYFTFDQMKIIINENIDFDTKIFENFMNQRRTLKLQPKNFNEFLYFINSIAAIKILCENNIKTFRKIEEIHDLQIQKETDQLHYFVNKHQLEFALSYAHPTSRLVFTQVSDFALIEDEIRCQIIIKLNNPQIKYDSILQPLNYQDQLIFDEQGLFDIKAYILSNEQRNQVQYTNRRDSFINKNFILQNQLFQEDYGQSIQIVDLIAQQDIQNVEEQYENIWD